MRIEEFGQGYGLLVEYYKSQLRELDEKERKSQRDLYFRMLKDMDGALWQEVVGVAIRTGKWFPKVSELVGFGRELLQLRGLVPDAEAAFSDALRAVRRLDPISLKPMSPVRDEVERTVRSLGGWGRLALVEDDQLGWYRKEFIAAWEGANGLRDRLQSTQQAGHPALGATQAALPSVTTRGEGVLDAVARTLDDGLDTP